MMIYDGRSDSSVALLPAAAVVETDSPSTDSGAFSPLRTSDETVLAEAVLEETVGDEVVFEEPTEEGVEREAAVPLLCVSCDSPLSTPCCSCVAAVVCEEPAALLRDVSVLTAVLVSLLQ